VVVDSDSNLHFNTFYNQNQMSGLQKIVTNNKLNMMTKDQTLEQLNTNSKSTHISQIKRNINKKQFQIKTSSYRQYQRGKISKSFYILLLFQISLYLRPYLFKATNLNV